MCVGMRGNVQTLRCGGTRPPYQVGQSRTTVPQCRLPSLVDPPNDLVQVTTGLSTRYVSSWQAQEGGVGSEAKQLSASTTQRSSHEPPQTTSHTNTQHQRGMIQQLKVKLRGSSSAPRRIRCAGRSVRSDTLCVVPSPSQRGQSQLVGVF